MTRQHQPALRAAEALLAEGKLHGCLAQLALAHPADPGDPALHHLAFRALARLADADAGQPPPIGAAQTALLRAMILHEACPERPRILHHGIASLLTSGNAATAGRVMELLSPAIGALLQETPEAPGLVLLLAVARGVMPAGGPPPRRISQLHLSGFPRFEAADLALPYSVKFSSQLFGANVADLLGRYPDAAAALDPAAGLGLRHLRLLDQLGLGPLFGPGDGAALARAITLRLQEAPQDEDETAAAHALVLRYLHDAEGPAVAALREAGLPEALLATAARWPRMPGAAGRAIPTLDAPVRVYTAAALNAARIAAPRLTWPGRRVRVALCVSGQLRGYAQALATWRRALLPFADFDIYLHSWTRVGMSEPQPARAFLPFEGAAFGTAWRRIAILEGFAQMKSRQPGLFRALERGATVDAARLQDLYGAREVVVEDETDPRFAAFSNQDKMHYKIHAADALARHSGAEYDLRMRLRPDLALRLPGFLWGALRRACARAPVIFADGGYGMHYGGLIIGDQVAVGAPETMTRYADTWTTHAELARCGAAGVPKRLTGHVSLAQTCWYANIAVQNLPFRRGALLDAQPLSSARVLAALEEDAAGRHDAVDAALIGAARADLAASGHHPRHLPGRP